MQLIYLTLWRNLEAARTRLRGAYYCFPLPWPEYIQLLQKPHLRSGTYLSLTYLRNTTMRFSLLSAALAASAVSTVLATEELKIEKTLEWRRRETRSRFITVERWLRTGLNLMRVTIEAHRWALLLERAVLSRGKFFLQGHHRYMRLLMKTWLIFIDGTMDCLICVSARRESWLFLLILDMAQEAWVLSPPTVSSVCQDRQALQHSH